jgi:hypothetical protein
MSVTEVPLAERAKIGGRPSLTPPARHGLLEGAINIERVGPAANWNDFTCREAGCSWHEKGVSVDTARLHAKSHSTTKTCHIFEGHLSAEEVAARDKELKRAANQGCHEKQPTTKFTTVREDGRGQRSTPWDASQLCVAPQAAAGGKRRRTAEEDGEEETEQDREEQYEPRKWPPQNSRR